MVCGEGGVDVWLVVVGMVLWLVASVDRVFGDEVLHRDA